MARFMDVPVGGRLTPVVPPFALWMKTQVVFLNGPGSQVNAVKICLTDDEPGQAEFRYFHEEERVFYSR
jgi:hypothetical protein